MIAPQVAAILTCLMIPMQYCARADYILRIQLLSYASIPHTKYNGFCCGAQDQASGICIEDCSNRFRFCLRPTGFSGESDACPESQVLVTGPISDDRMEFESGVELDDGVPNPIVFTGKRWLVSLACGYARCSTRVELGARQWPAPGYGWQLGICYRTADFSM